MQDIIGFLDYFPYFEKMIPESWNSGARRDSHYNTM
jgi:hypothetical protein